MSYQPDEVWPGVSEPDQIELIEAADMPVQPVGSEDTELDDFFDNPDVAISNSLAESRDGIDVPTDEPERRAEPAEPAEPASPTQANLTPGRREPEPLAAEQSPASLPVAPAMTSIGPVRADNSPETSKTPYPPVTQTLGATANHSVATRPEAQADDHDESDGIVQPEHRPEGESPSASPERMQPPDLPEGAEGIGGSPPDEPPRASNPGDQEPERLGRAVAIDRGMDDVAYGRVSRLVPRRDLLSSTLTEPLEQLGSNNIEQSFPPVRPREITRNHILHPVAAHRAMANEIRQLSSVLRLTEHHAGRPVIDQTILLPSSPQNTERVQDPLSFAYNAGGFRISIAPGERPDIRRAPEERTEPQPDFIPITRLDDSIHLVRPDEAERYCINVDEEGVMRVVHQMQREVFAVDQFYFTTLLETLTQYFGGYVVLLRKVGVEPMSLTNDEPSNNARIAARILSSNTLKASIRTLETQAGLVAEQLYRVQPDPENEGEIVRAYDTAFQRVNGYFRAIINGRTGRY